MTATAVRPADVLRISVRIAAAKSDARLHDSTYDEQDPTMTPIADPTVRPEQTSELTLQNRTRDMHLMHEAMARAHIQQLHHEAEHERLVRRIVDARRLRRRAERASMRARRALATALMQ
ncbi:hypothetical protein ACIQGZ_06105 [Streptomyces sp. NPDC092296]|uniref:hypothetical protein n=1 Tax=Streptomyces sp. NPDC092296 TaxID=3366012 RepID=UPI003828FBD8